MHPCFKGCGGFSQRFAHHALSYEHRRQQGLTYCVALPRPRQRLIILHGVIVRHHCTALLSNMWKRLNRTHGVGWTPAADRGVVPHLFHV